MGESGGETTGSFHFLGAGVWLRADVTGGAGARRGVARKERLWGQAPFVGTTRRARCANGA